MTYSESLLLIRLSNQRPAQALHLLSAMNPELGFTLRLTWGVVQEKSPHHLLTLKLILHSMRSFMQTSFPSHVWVLSVSSVLEIVSCRAPHRYTPFYDLAIFEDMSKIVTSTTLTLMLCSGVLIHCAWMCWMVLKILRERAHSPHYVCVTDRISILSAWLEFLWRKKYVIKKLTCGNPCVDIYLI